MSYEVYQQVLAFEEANRPLSVLEKACLEGKSVEYAELLLNSLAKEYRKQKLDCREAIYG